MTHRRQSWRPLTIPALASRVDNAGHHFNVPAETGDGTVKGRGLLLGQGRIRSTP
jgi:hypothetical protein